MYHDRRSRSKVPRARDSAAGCGVDRTVTEATRPGWLPAMSQATPPPQSWPTRWDPFVTCGVDEGDDVADEVLEP